MLRSIIFALLLANAFAAHIDANNTSSPVYVVHVVADDLGNWDVNWRNQQVITPTLDGLVKVGVELPQFYAYMMCSPTRGSILSGRYPYHIGFYQNNGGDNEGVPLGFKMLPDILTGWSTHALGKWHCGWVYKSYLPTYRGFDTFYGSSGNTNDYWEHLGGGSCNKALMPRDSADPVGDNPEGFRDFLDANGTDVKTVDPSAFGQYDARLLSNRAVQIVNGHDTAKSLYIYFAFHNVHVPLEAPLDTVERFPFITTDARKVADAMLTELDYGVGNVSAALDTRGMSSNTVWIFHSGASVYSGTPPALTATFHTTHSSCRQWRPRQPCMQFPSTRR
jgi:arylsulfatase A-like enzyme